MHACTACLKVALKVALAKIMDTSRAALMLVADQRPVEYSFYIYIFLQFASVAPHLEFQK